MFVNVHQPAETLGRVLQGKRLFNLKVCLFVGVSAVSFVVNRW